MNSSTTIPASTAPEATADPSAAPDGPCLYTWISEKGRVLEQVRLVRRGERLRARGHVIAAPDEDHPAFSFAYEAEIDNAGALKRVGLTTVTLDGERTVDLVRDGEGAWLMDRAGARSRVGDAGVVDVDISFSAFFASLIIKRHGLHAQPGSVDERVLALDVVTLDVTEDTVTFTSDDERIHGITSTASTTATVDGDGIIVDVEGLTRRA